MLGDDILVAPVLEKGATRRTVMVPRGTWTGDDGSTMKSPQTAIIEAPLDRLPVYQRS